MPRAKNTKEEREAEKHERDLQVLVVKLRDAAQQAGYAYLIEPVEKQKGVRLAEFCKLKKQRDEAIQELRLIADATIIESNWPGFQRMTYSDLLTRTDEELRLFFDGLQLNVKGFIRMLPGEIRQDMATYSDWAKKIKDLERNVECLNDGVI